MLAPLNRTLAVAVFLAALPFAAAAQTAPAPDAGATPPAASTTAPAKKHHRKGHHHAKKKTVTPAAPASNDMPQPEPPPIKH